MNKKLALFLYNYIKHPLYLMEREVEWAFDSCPVTSPVYHDADSWFFIKNWFRLVKLWIKVKIHYWL